MTADPKRQARERERGLALLVVLWGVTAAALLVSAFNVVARSGATFISSEIALTEAEALADAGLEIAAAHLIDDDKARRWRPDGKPRRLVLGEAELTIIIDDPNGLVDVNKASRAVLLGLLSRAMGGSDEAEPLLERLMALRGKQPAEPSQKAPEAQELAGPNDTAPGAQPIGEQSQVGSPPASAPQPRIHDISQLRHIEGMSPALFRKIAPLLTVYSRDSRINPFHAPRDVLLAIPGLSEMDVDRFLDSRPSAVSEGERLPGSLGKAGASLANHTGPAYIVSVAVGKSGRKRVLGRQFVIATGIDANAPYRLLSTRPLSAGSVTWEENAVLAPSLSTSAERPLPWRERAGAAKRRPGEGEDLSANTELAATSSPSPTRLRREPSPSRGEGGSARRWHRAPIASLHLEGFARGPRPVSNSQDGAPQS